MTRRLWRLPWFVSSPSIVPYLTLPASLSSLLLCSHMLCLCDRPDVSGLTNALTARLTLIYFLWNLGAGGNNTEWHYLFIKSKAAFLGRVEMWRLDTTPPPRSPHTHIPPAIFDCAMIRRSGESLNLIQGDVFEIWQSREQRDEKEKKKRLSWSNAIKLSRHRFNPAMQFGRQFIKNVFCLN